MLLFCFWVKHYKCWHLAVDSFSTEALESCNCLPSIGESAVNQLCLFYPFTLLTCTCKSFKIYSNLYLIPSQSYWVFFQSLSSGISFPLQLYCHFLSNGCDHLLRTREFATVMLKVVLSKLVHWKSRGETWIPSLAW